MEQTKKKFNLNNKNKVLICLALLCVLIALLIACSLCFNVNIYASAFSEASNVKFDQETGVFDYSTISDIILGNEDDFFEGWYYFYTFDKTQLGNTTGSDILDLCITNQINDLCIDSVAHSFAYGLANDIKDCDSLFAVTNSRYLKSGQEYSLIIVYEYRPQELDSDEPFTYGYLTINGEDFLTFEYHKEIDLPADPVKEGYHFVGWYYDQEYTNPYKSGDIIYDDTELYAKFEINTYTLTFHALGEIVDTVEVQYMDTCPADEDGACDRPYSHDDYDFSGWYLNENYTENWDWNKPIKSNLDLYADMNCHYWTIDVVVDGKVVDTIQHQKDACPEDLPDGTPYADVGYQFDGWYLDADYTVEYKDNAELDTMFNEITLYAKISEKKCKVTFYVDGIVYEEIEVPYGSILVDNKELAKCCATLQNMQFLASDGTYQKVTETTILDDDMTIRAEVNASIAGWNAFGMWWVDNWYWVLIGLIGAIVIVVLCVVMYKRA